MPNAPFYEDGGSREQDELADRMRARRGGELLNLDRMLLNSPPFAEGWNIFMPRVRNDLALTAFESELIICAVGKLNGADYEVRQHAPLLVEAGATPAQMAALDDVDAASRNADLFSRSERAILRFTLESTRDVKISPQALADLKAVFPDARRLFEVAGVAAAYNMVSRILVAMDVPIEGA